MGAIHLARSDKSEIGGARFHRIFANETKATVTQNLFTHKTQLPGSTEIYKRNSFTSHDVISVFLLKTRYDVDCD